MSANAEASAASIVDYFLGNKCIADPVLQHIRLQLYLSSVNVISFLARLRDLPDSHICRETVDQCILYSPIVTFSTKDAWLAPTCYTQPTQEELSNLSNVLKQVCGKYLLVDLINIVTSYLTKNVVRYNVGMPIDLLSTIDLLTGVINVERRIVIVKAIESLGGDEQNFFCVETIGLHKPHDEWIVVPSERIQLLHNYKGEIVRKWRTFNFSTSYCGQWVDYREPNSCEWQEGRLETNYRNGVGIRGKFGIVCLDVAPFGTFTDAKLRLLSCACSYSNY